MSRELSFLPLCLTLVATQLGGGSILGASEEAYASGWMVIFYPLGYALGLFTLALGYGSKLRQLNVSTVPEIFETVYRSRELRLISSFISILSLYFIFVAQGIAARKFLASINFEEPIWFAIFWLVFVFYTVMGGFKAVVNTDIIQTTFIIFGLTIALLCLDVETISSSLDNATLSSATFSDIPWVAWLLMPFCFMLIEQDMAQRFFAARNTKIISPAAIIAALLILFGSAVSILFGILANSQSIAISTEGSILIKVITEMTNPVITSLFMATIIMAIASTADSLLCSISSQLYCDFLEKRKLSQKSGLNISRLITFAIGVSALVLVYLFDNVLNVLILSYELSVSTLFVPITIAVIFKKPSQKGAILSFICGAIGFVLFRSIAPLPLSKEVLTLLLAFIGYNIGKVINKN